MAAIAAFVSFILALILNLSTGSGSLVGAHWGRFDQWTFVIIGLILLAVDLGWKAAVIMKDRAV